MFRYVGLEAVTFFSTIYNTVFLTPVFLHLCRYTMQAGMNVCVCGLGEPWAEVFSVV